GVRAAAKHVSANTSRIRYWRTRMGTTSVMTPGSRFRRTPTSSAKRRMTRPSAPHPAAAHVPPRRTSPSKAAKKGRASTATTAQSTSRSQWKDLGSSHHEERHGDDHGSGQEQDAAGGGRRRHGAYLPSDRHPQQGDETESCQQIERGRAQPGIMKARWCAGASDAEHRV